MVYKWGGKNWHKILKKDEKNKGFARWYVYEIFDAQYFRTPRR